LARTKVQEMRKDLDRVFGAQNSLPDDILLFTGTQIISNEDVFLVLKLPQSMGPCCGIVVRFKARIVLTLSVLD
jgi:hypothetical protein